MPRNVFTSSAESEAPSSTATGSQTLRFGLALAMVALSSAWLGAAPALAQPTFDKTFLPSTIGPGSTSVLHFDIVNNSGTPVTEMAFTDTLPAGVTIATPASAMSDCGGTLTAPDGGTVISLADGTLGGLSSCAIDVNVTSSTPGVHMNVSGDLTSDAGNSGTAAADLTVATDRPGFSKSFAPSTVPLGSRSTLTFFIDNLSNASLAFNLTFSDSLPSGMVVASPANESTTCTGGVITAAAGGNVISYGPAFGGDASVAAGASCTVVVDVVGAAAGSLENTSGDLTSVGGVTLRNSGKATAALDVTVTPLALQKAFVDDPVPPGGTVTLEFTIDNFDRDFPATGITFTDDLAAALAGLTFDSLLANDCGGSVSGAGTTDITFSGGAVGPGGSCTIQVSLSVPAGATPGAYTNTTGAIAGTVDGSPVAGNVASDDLFVEPAPILTKEFLEDGTLLPDPVVNSGDDVVMRFTITNTSTTSSATAITFTDELTTFLPFPVSAVLPALPCGAGSSIFLATPDVDVQVLTLTGGSLAAAPGAGSTCTFDVTLTIPAAFPPGVYVNTTDEITATVDGATRIGDPASDDFTVIAAPQLTKEFTDDPVEPGGTVTLEFTLTHSADATADATGITFTDDLAPVLAGLTANLPPSPDPPCGAGSTLTGSAGDTLLTLMGGTLMPGEICAFSVTLDVPVGAASGTFPNTTSGVSATVDGLPATSVASTDDLEVAGLTFTKEFIGDPVIPGDTVTLRFTIENVHPTDDATGIGFSDSLAAVLPGTPDLTAVLPPSVNTCGGSLSGTSTLMYSGGSLAKGLTCTVDVTVMVPVGAAEGAFINTTSNLSATQSGGPVTIDPAVDDLVVDSNLLQLTKEFTDDPVAPGGTVTLEFTLTNLDASQAASGVGFTDDLNAALADLTFDSVLLDTCAGTVAGTGTTGITVSGVSLGAAGTCTISASLSVPGDAVANIYTNMTSEVSGTINGFAVTGDAASDTLEVLNLLEFSKSFDGPTTGNGTPMLTFTIVNSGSSAADEVSFSDDLNAVIAGLTATGLPLDDVCGTGSQIAGTSFLTLTGGSLPPDGGMCSIDVPLLVPGTAVAGTFPNTTSDLLQAGLKVADPATADLTVETSTFSKAFVPDFILPSGRSALTFLIEDSTGVFPVTDLAFVDNLPAEVVVAPSADIGTTCTGGVLTAPEGGGVISYSGGELPAGGSCIVQVDVTSAVPGTYVNTSGALTSSTGTSAVATDTLVVLSSGGPCLAPDGDNLTLQDETFLDAQEFVVCDTITVEPNVGVFGPDGDLTLRAGVLVVFGEGFEVGVDGRLTVSIEPILIP